MYPPSGRGNYNHATNNEVNTDNDDNAITANVDILIHIWPILMLIMQETAIAISVTNLTVRMLICVTCIADNADSHATHRQSLTVIYIICKLYV